MAEWKLFDGELPEPPEYLKTRPCMNLEGQPGFPARAQLVVDLARLVYETRVESISELGCGDGSLLARIAYSGVGARCWGYDLGLADIAYGRTRGLDLRYGDIVAGEGIEYGELIIASEVVEHIEDPEGFLRRLPGRLLIVSSPASETGDWHNRIHAWAWDQEGYAELVTRSGWEVVAHRTCDGGENTFDGVTGRQTFQAILAVR